MKIDAYSEQKKAAAAYDEQQKRAAQIKGTVSGAALTQAVTFTKSDGKMELFAASSYASIFMNFLQKIMQGTLNSLHSLFYLSAFLFGCLAFLCGFENLNTAVP